MIDRLRYETRTKKEYLSKTGKEGNTVLLHDCFKREQIWWKEITVERIIENLPREQPETEYVL
jgi:prophage tail gpP-like protein